MTQDAEQPVVTRTYVVRGPGSDLVLDSIADLDVGPRGELVLKGADGGVGAIVAPGHWFHVSVAEDGDAEA